MGAPMLAALRRANIDVKGFDVIAGRGDDITITAFKQSLTTLITVVRDTAETDALLFTDQAMIDAVDLRTIIIASTLPPSYVRDLRARVPAHITLIDAPMSGAQIRAEAGTLSFMLGGAMVDIDAHRHIFDTMGQDIYIMGQFGDGMAAKVLNNLLAASSTAMTRMVLDWADHAGIPEDKLRALIHTSSGQNWLASGFGDIEFSRDGYADDNSIGILVKDVAAGLDLAPAGADTTLPVAVQAMLRQMSPRK